VGRGVSVGASVGVAVSVGAGVEVTVGSGVKVSVGMRWVELGTGVGESEAGAPPVAVKLQARVVKIRIVNTKLGLGFMCRL
jgi:opacity protein-like surface antigen